MSVLDRLNRVFRDVLENNLIMLNPNTTAADIEEWDSLSHVRIVLAVEQEFKLRLKAGEISGLENVGAFVALLERKLAA
jgi:acyl carrier protein